MKINDIPRKSIVSDTKTNDIQLKSIISCGINEIVRKSMIWDENKDIVIMYKFIYLR